MRLSCSSERDRSITLAHIFIVLPHKTSKLCKHTFIVPESCRALAYPTKFIFRLQHVERRMLEGLTGQAVENVGKSKHFYSATVYQSRLSFYLVALKVHMAFYDLSSVIRNSLKGIMVLERMKRLLLCSTRLSTHHTTIVLQRTHSLYILLIHNMSQNPPSFSCSTHQ